MVSLPPGKIMEKFTLKLYKRFPMSWYFYLLTFILVFITTNVCYVGCYQGIAISTVVSRM